MKKPQTWPTHTFRLCVCVVCADKTSSSYFIINHFLFVTHLSEKEHHFYCWWWTKRGFIIDSRMILFLLLLRNDKHVRTSSKERSVSSVYTRRRPCPGAFKIASFCGLASIFVLFRYSFLHHHPTTFNIISLWLI